MATKDFRVTGYWVHLDSKLLINSNLGQHEAIPAQAMIQCVGENGENMAVFFLNETREGDDNKSDSWPTRAKIEGNSVFAEMFAPIEQYPYYLDMLRNEDPVRVVVDSVQAFRTRMYCNEPVGDGEFF